MANDIIITPVSASIQFSGSAYASIKLTVDTSGSLLVTGNSGSLFSVTDNLSGSLMSVNTIAGLPIMEIFSDNRVNIGKYASEAIKVQSGGSDVALGSGSVMFITSSGRVGIGVNSPVNKLDVSGNISCSAITASFFGTSSWATNSLTASSLVSANSYNITNLTASNQIIYKNSVLLDYSSSTLATSQSNYVVLQNLTGSYNSAFFDYFASSASNFRAGTMIVGWSGSGITYTEYATTDIGNTNQLTMSVVISASYIQLLSNAYSSLNWNVKSSGKYL